MSNVVRWRTAVKTYRVRITQAGLSIKEIEPVLSAGGDAAEMKFMECCHYLWKVDGVELVEPFIFAAFNKLPEKSRCVLFQRILTIVYLAQDGEQLPTPPE
jgi:hypothetical protein